MSRFMGCEENDHNIDAEEKEHYMFALPAEVPVSD